MQRLTTEHTVQVEIDLPAGLNVSPITGGSGNKVRITYMSRSSQIDAVNRVEEFYLAVAEVVVQLKRDLVEATAP